MFSGFFQSCHVARTGSVAPHGIIQKLVRRRQERGQSFLLLFDHPFHSDTSHLQKSFASAVVEPKVLALS
jgi:hypothetical protein